MAVSPSAVFIRAGRIHSSRARQAIHANSKAFPNAIPLRGGGGSVARPTLRAYPSRRVTGRQILGDACILRGGATYWDRFLGSVKTSSGARTSLFVPDLDRLF